MRRARRRSCCADRLAARAFVRPVGIHDVLSDAILPQDAEDRRAARIKRPVQVVLVSFTVRFAVDARLDEHFPTFDAVARHEITGAAARQGAIIDALKGFDVGPKAP